MRLRPVRHRIVTANLYVGNKDPLAGVNAIIARTKSVFRLPPDAIGIQEGHGHGVLEALSRVQGYELFCARENGEAGKDVPVLLRSKWKCLSVAFIAAVEGTGTDNVFDHPPRLPDREVPQARTQGCPGQHAHGRHRSDR